MTRPTSSFSPSATHRAHLTSSRRGYRPSRAPRIPTWWSPHSTRHFPPPSAHLSLSPPILATRRRRALEFPRQLPPAPLTVVRRRQQPTPPQSLREAMQVPFTPPLRLFLHAAARAMRVLRTQHRTPSVRVAPHVTLCPSTSCPRSSTSSSLRRRVRSRLCSVATSSPTLTGPTQSLVRVQAGPWPSIASFPSCSRPPHRTPYGAEQTLRTSS